MINLQSSIICSFICALIFSCKPRSESSVQDAGVIGANGAVVLFYREGNNIIIKRCQNYSVLKTRDDCKLYSGTFPTIVDVEMFRKHLQITLNLSPSAYDTDTQSKIGMFNGGERTNTPELENQKAKLLKDVQKIRDFVAAYGEENINKQEKDSLELQLKSVEQQITYNQQVPDAIKNINDRINDLIEKTISDPKISFFASPKDKSGFVFNILTSYLVNSPPVFDFKLIPAGSFLMGSPASEPLRSQDEFQHVVNISKAFEMSATETTQMQWFTVMGSNDGKFNKKMYCPDDYILINGTELCPSLPVDQVNLKSVALFIEKLNAKGVYKYRLPTEAEWEYAARAGTTTAYNLGSTITSDKVNFNPVDTQGIYRKQPSPVGSLNNANAWGLSDMHGNVAEWVSDFYDPNFYSSAEARQDPKVTDNGVGRGNAIERSNINRGGHGDTSASNCRSASRKTVSNNWYEFVGFRLVRESSQNK